MGNRKKISVIMGIYNCADTLKESIDSIIGQTYNDWELIMCNDASTDNTLEVAQEYAMKDNRIKVIENKFNKGLAYSLNRCLQFAKGEYIARHDGDDICLPERFEKQIKFIEENNVDLLGTAVEYFDMDGTWGKHKLKMYPDKNDVFKQSMFSHPTILLKRSLINSVNGYTVSDITLRSEDYDLFAKLYSKGIKGANLQEVLLRVRRDKDAYKRRKFKYRIDESRCKFKAWKLLKIKANYLPIIILPIIKGIIPVGIVKKYHSIKFSN